MISDLKNSIKSYKDEKEEKEYASMKLKRLAEIITKDENKIMAKISDPNLKMLYS